MRAPRNLNEYELAEDIAVFLEDMAHDIRAMAERKPLVKCSLDLRYWNPDWVDKSKPKPEVVCMAVKYGKRAVRK